MAEQKSKMKKKNEVIHEAKVEEIGSARDSKWGLGIVAGLLVLLISVAIIWKVQDHTPASPSDAIKFKEEYEQYNGKTNEKNDKKYNEVKISKDNSVDYASYKEVLEILEEKNEKSAVIYFGFSTCPWCRTLVPVLLDAQKEAGVEKIYYLDASSSRDEKVLKDGKIVTEKEGTEEYYQLVKKLDSVLGPYEGLEDDSIKRLYFPTVLFIKDGKVVDIHIDTIESQKDGYEALSEDQKKELKAILVEKMEKILACDSAC